MRATRTTWMLGLLWVGAAGCTVRALPPASDAGGRADAPRIDAGMMDAPADATADATTDAAADGLATDTNSRDAPDARVDPCSDSCGPVDLCGDLGDGNGLDDDCDGQVDEDCVCAPGQARACFPGRPDQRLVGACADGVEVCNEFTRYDPCTGGQFPSAETCNGTDDDCDGTVDDGLTGCATALLCPGSERATPLRAHPLRGSAIDGGAATAWNWTVICPDTVTTCPTPADPTARDTDVYLLESDNYRVRLEVTLADGSTNQCEWVVYARGGGLRVELDWDAQGLGRGNTDVDLHLHRRSIAPGATTGETPFFDFADDCFYLNCKASTYGYDMDSLRTRWALPPTADLSVCEEAPEGEGGNWVALHGACFNPRLDVDVISCDPAVTDPRDGAFCAPENINIDDPPLGDPYRIWVNYYSDHGYLGDVHPTVDVYCWGELRGSFGVDPNLITLTNGDETTTARGHSSWWVADVVFAVDECGRPTCRVAPLGDVRDASDFGRPWSF